MEEEDPDVVRLKRLRNVRQQENEESGNAPLPSIQRVDHGPRREPYDSLTSLYDPEVARLVEIHQYRQHMNPKTVSTSAGPSVDRGPRSETSHDLMATISPEELEVIRNCGPRVLSNVQMANASSPNSLAHGPRKVSDTDKYLQALGEEAG
jgi:hypothetical protein